MRIFDKNNEWRRKSSTVIPSSCSTLAKSPSRLIKDFSPFCAVSAAGSHFKDIDGNIWLDCEMAMGTVIWGHCSPLINEAITRQLLTGISFSVAGINELELAQLLLNKFHQYQAVKFFKNGADSVYAAVRASRYLTGKQSVLSCEYHGWLDWSCFSCYAMEPCDCGIPDNMKETCLHCEPAVRSIIETISQNSQHLACVVLCPGTYTKEELFEVTQLCKQLKIYTIFDEVSSGVRYGKCGVTGAYEIYPDYLCLSKGLTNGLPLALCLGSSEGVLIMEKLKISNAHSSENLSIEAAIASEKALQAAPVWPVWKEAGDMVMDQIKETIIANDLCEVLELRGYAGNFHVASPSHPFYDDPFRTYLLKEFSKYGIFSKGFILLSAAHTLDEINFIGDTICESIAKYKKHL